MFWRVLRMELARACRPSRIVMIILAILLMLFVSDLRLIQWIFQNGYVNHVGIIEKLGEFFSFDTFKCVFVVLLAGLHANSFCKDDNGKYLRMILSRVDVTTYTQCRFLANLLVVLMVAICSFYGYALMMSPVMPLLHDIRNVIYYYEVAQSYPVLYIGMYGYILGIAAAASSSVGLLLSVYRPNSFVSIGLGGVVFFAVLSYVPESSLFCVLRIVGMDTTIGYELPWQLMFLWATVYLLAVVGICGVLFYRRMKWRVENGFL